MSQKTCLVCERPHPRERCTILELTATEEASLVKRGLRVPEEFVYCKKCWDLIKDPQVGPQLMRNAAERQMLKLGVNPARARAVANRYYDRLLEIQRQRHHKVH